METIGMIGLEMALLFNLDHVNSIVLIKIALWCASFCYGSKYTEIKSNQNHTGLKVRIR